MKFPGKTNRLVMSVAAAFLLGSSGTQPAQAEDFPSKPIEMVVPYQAGGLLDNIGRTLAPKVEEILGQPIVVVNKPGGGATIGLTSGFTAKPDGYTIVFTTSSPIALQPLHGKTAYQPDDFQGIVKIFDIPSSMNVNAKSDTKTLDEWVAWVKENPGKFTYGTAGGTGSGGHIASQQLADALGLEIKHVPFEGQAQLKAAVSGGQIMGSNTVPDVHRGGDMYPVIFVTDARPSDPMYKDIPTTTDKGIDAVVTFFSGIVGHKDIPADRAQAIHDAFKTAMEDKAFKDLMAKYKMDASYADGAAFNKIIAGAVESNRKAC